MDAARILKPMIAAAAVVAMPVMVLSASTSSEAKPHPTTSLPPAEAARMTPTTAAAAPTTTSTTSPIPASSVVTETTTIATQASTQPIAVQGCWADLAVQVGWPADALGHLVSIIERESHCDPASNTGYRPSTGDWSIGLLQINTLGSLLEARQAACGIGAREELLDPATNLACGLALYRASGFGPWGG